VQASLEQRQRFQQLFFPDGIAFDGNCFVRTAVTAPAFSYLRPINAGNEGLVGQMGIEPFPQNDLLTVDYSRVVAPALRKPTGRLVSEIVPQILPNKCLPSTNTVTYGETPRDSLPDLSR
jgi:hypothetical protein